MNKRLSFIDISRGWAIIFIVFGHTIVHSANCDIIYKLLCGFHVVFFFILSGYTFKIKDNEKFTDFVKKKFLRIMVPYFIWALLFILPYMVLGAKVASEVDAKGSFDLIPQVLKVFYGNGNEQALKQNTALWFLPALFSMEIIYYWIIKYIKNKKDSVKVFTIMPIIIIAFLTNYFLKFILPWGLNTVLVLGIFFYIGYLFNHFDLLSKKRLFKIYYMIPVLILGIISCYMNDKVSCVNYRYGNLLLSFISGLCLSTSVIYISYLLNKNRILEYVGKNTMDILIFHKILIIIFQAKLGIISKLLKNSNLIVEFLMGCIIVVLSIVLSIFIAKTIDKILSLVKKRLKISN